MAHLRGLGLENFRVYKNYTEFDFAPITILTGPNNSGKSSLNKAILLFHDNIQQYFQFDSITYRSDIHTLTGPSVVLKRKTNDLVYRHCLMNDLWYEFIILEGVRILRKKLVNDKNEIIIDSDIINGKVEINITLLINALEKIANYRSEYPQIYSELYKKDLIEKADNTDQKSEFNVLINSLKRIDKNKRTVNVSVDKKKYISFEYITAALKSIISEDIKTNSINDYFDYLLQKIYLNIEYLPSIRGQQSRSYEPMDENLINKLINSLVSKHHESLYRPFIIKWLQKFNIGTDYFIEYDEQNNINYINIEKNGKYRSLLDYGYGITKIATILLKISQVASNNITLVNDTLPMYPDQKYDESIFSIKPSTIIIEEPESNLHPDFQSRLAELFIDAARSFNIQFIIETHSEYMIRKLQYLVADKSNEFHIHPEDTAIFYFKHPKVADNNSPHAYRINIREDGMLDKEFGSGFYDESLKINFDLLNIKNAQKS